MRQQIGLKSLKPQEEVSGMAMHSTHNQGSGTAGCMSWSSDQVGSGKMLYIEWIICFQRRKKPQQVSLLGSHPCAVRASSVHPICGGDCLLTVSGLFQPLSAGQKAPLTYERSHQVGTNCTCLGLLGHSSRALHRPSYLVCLG